MHLLHLLHQVAVSGGGWKHTAGAWCICCCIYCTFCTCSYLITVNRGFDVGEISAALPEHLQQAVLLHMHERLVRSV